MKKQELEAIIQHFDNSIREQLIHCAKESARYPEGARQCIMIDELAQISIDEHHRYNKQRGTFVTEQYRLLITRYREDYKRNRL